MLPEPSGERREVLVRSILRILAITLAMLLLYAFVPVPGRSGVAAVLEMFAGLALFLVLVGWQLQTIVRAEYPVLRAVEAISLALLLLVITFSFTFLTLSRADPGSFSEHLDRVDAMYYTVSTLATVGFGDITPTSAGARIIVTFQMLLDLALVAGLVRLIILATRTGLQRRSGSEQT